MPVYFVRFEDLLQNPRKNLNEVFGFILSKRNLSGSVCEQRIDEVLAMGAQANTLYTVKKGGGGILKNLYRYSNTQIKMIKKELADLIYFFGYSNNEENLHGVFDYSKEEETDKMRNQYLGYQMLNEKTWAWMDNSPEEVEQVKVQINHKNDGFGFI